MVLKLFYFFKPLLPRSLQIALRSFRARRIWKAMDYECIPTFSDLETSYVWPAGIQAAALVTHDVESEIGQENIPALRAIEDEQQIRSTWNFVVNRYRVDEDLIQDLTADGHAIGVHGLKHDGKLFSSKEEFGKRWQLILDAARRWKSSGFRSPALLHDMELLKTITLKWDSSLPAWDPFQPMPGGCRKFVPFMLNSSCVELPVTTWQDFTLFEELQLESIDVWRTQIEYIYEEGGLINLIVHPDYMLTEKRLQLFWELLEYLKNKQGLWIATADDVADWVLSQKKNLSRLRIAA